MVAVYRIPRNSLIWLLASMFAGIAPHLSRLPLWLSLVCLLCGAWRVMVYRSRWRLPGRWLKALLVFSGVAAVLGHYGTLMGPDAGTALLILGFCFKLLETHNRRDAFTVVVLGFFVIATSFFYSQSMASAAYLLVVCFMVTAALIGLNQTPMQMRPGRTAKRALILLVQSLPLMLVLFLLVPRVAPLWSLDLSGSRAKTGLSDRITPGDIAALSRSPELAFRVEFDGPSPPPSKLYWRALVLDHYDGATWSRGPIDMDAAPMTVNASGQRQPWQRSIEYLGERYRYRVIMEPTDQRWLFALAAARTDTNSIVYSRDHRLLSQNPVSQPFSYWLDSDLNYRLDPELPSWLARQNLQLPASGNPRARQLAADWLTQAGSRSAYVERVLQAFRQQPFRYTLRPPPLRGDRIDQFLFESRQGFCSHFAGAFVFMMRAAGIPARIVAGYQGGERNPLGGYLLVHQFDAHAWAEVWLPGRGWTHVDPTAAVAPTRIEQGVEQALAGEQSFLEGSFFSPLRYRGLTWLTQLRLGLDYINFAWHRSVLGYDAQLQAKFLSKLLGPIDFKTLGLWLMALISLVMLAIATGLFWNRRRRDPLLELYLLFCRKMAARGLVREPGEAPEHYRMRLVQRWPQQAETLAELTRLFSEGRYGRQAADQASGEGSGKRRDDVRLQRIRQLVRKV